MRKLSRAVSEGDRYAIFSNDSVGLKIATGEMRKAHCDFCGILSPNSKDVPGLSTGQNVPTDGERKTSLAYSKKRSFDLCDYSDISSRRYVC